jgi:hypothetical protein
VRWSEYLPDGLLADMLAQPAHTTVEHREFEALERIGGWDRIIAWAQGRQLREISSFMHSAQVRNAGVGASTSQAYDSAVAEVGLMLRVSARTASGRVNDALSLTTRLRSTLAALEQGRITMAKARVLDAETLNLSDEHAAQVEHQVLGKARQQTPGQLRAATRRAVLVADPQAAKDRGEQARRERGVRMWPEPDGMATVSAYLPAADATGVYAVLDEHAHRAGSAADERSMEGRRADALVLNPTGYASASTTAARNTTVPTGTRPGAPCGPAGATTVCRCAWGRCRRGGGVDVRVTVPYTALRGSDELPGELAGYGPIPAGRRINRTPRWATPPADHRPSAGTGFLVNPARPGPAYGGAHHRGVPADVAPPAAGSGTAVSVAAQLPPDRQGLTGAEVKRALLRGGTGGHDVRRFRGMLQGRKLGGGKFGAARYDRQDARHVAEFVVTYYETVRGGYTIEQKRGVDRSRWFTLAPASRPQLAQRLADLLDSIRI